VKRLGPHGQIILFDKGIRNEVGGGQSILLTDYQFFTSLYAATRQDDRVEYKKPKKFNEGGQALKSKSEVCHRFNGPNGC